MTQPPDDSAAALSRSISAYCAEHGVEFSGWQLQDSLTVLRHQAKVYRIHERILWARRHINAAAVERFEVHDDEAAEAIMDQPTPRYPGDVEDDHWLKANCGYGILEGGVPLERLHQVKPKEEAPATARGRAVSTQASSQARNALQEPEATAAVLLASLLDDPVRLDRHMESLAGLPCGRFAIVRDLLLELPEGPEGPTSHPAVLELTAALRPQGGAARGYSPDGWERAARSLAARWPQG